MSKISKKELESLSESEKKFSAIKFDLGTLEVQKHNLLHVFAQVQEESNKEKKALEDKYGKINIDLTDGTYKEIAEEAEIIK
jgi:hypothetical protein